MTDLNALSPREREIVDLLLEHRTNQMIADHLGISVHTVNAHRARAMLKLGVKSMHEVWLGQNCLL